MSNIYKNYQREVDNDSKIKYRSTKSFRIWMTVLLCSFIGFLIVTPFVPKNENELPFLITFSMLIVFISFIVAIDHLVTNYLQQRKIN